MRITFRQTFDDGIQEVSRVAGQLADAQRQVSSGKRINVPSDDPSGMAVAIGEHATVGSVDAYKRSAGDAASRLAVADSTMSDIVSQLTAARVNATAALGTGRSQTQLDTFSTEIAGIRDALLNDINTRFGSSYVFSGASANAPFTALGGGATSAYQGDSNVQVVDVSNGRTAQVSFDGSAIMQGTDAVHILDALTSLSTAIRSGDAAGMQQGIDAIDRAFERALSMQTTVGIAQRSVEDVQPQLDAARIGATTQISKIEDADLAVAISDMTRADTAQRAALGAFATLGRITLMDYIK